ncbi:MAG TPA: diguanylate cyclase [Chloroflexota bacterium]|nr:diguanylate cyclase [Chloroflexota bacterium]
MRIILDCGSGARGLGQHLLGPQGPSADSLRLHLFIGHTHWDHIQGFPFFEPAFLPETELNIYAAAGFQRSLEDSLAGQMQYSYFPVRLRELRSRLHFIELEEGFFRVGDVLVETQHLNHTAPTIAYRISADGVTVAYTTDHEPFWKPGGIDFRHPGDQRHVAFLKDADLVIHDAQYTADEYDRRVGWGHSTVEYATDVSIAAGARRLALFHHDPARDDASLAAMERDARVRAARRDSPVEIFAAAEGLALSLRGQSQAPASDGISAIRRQSVSGKRVLLIGVDEFQREAITSELGEDNLRLLHAPTGPATLDRVRAMAPDLVVVAAAPPTASSEFIREIRQRTGRASLPVLLLTNDAEPEGNPHDQGAAATDYLASPVSAPMLRSRVRAWLARTSVGASSPTPIGSSERAAQQQADHPPMVHRGTGSPEQLAQALALVPVFRSLTPEQLRVLAECGTEYIFDPGYAIIRQHESSDQIYVILSGRVRVSEESDEPPNGDAVIAEIGAGEVVGEMAMLHDRPRSASVVSSEPTRCLALPAADFGQILRSSPDLAMALMRVLANRIHETDRRLARYAPDPLTGLPNRRAFHDQYARIAAQARRRGRGATLVSLDIVRLRAINDRFGYDVGDEALRAVADTLNENARKADLVARYGGDEFALLLVDVEPSAVQPILARVAQQISELGSRRGVPVPIRCAWGAASADVLPDVPDALLVQADEDMQRRRPSAEQV